MNTQAYSHIALVTVNGRALLLERSVARRIAMEKRVIKCFAHSAIAAGCTISVHNGECFELKRSKVAADVVAACMSTDEEHLLIRNAAGERIGQVFLVYGNDGYDVINDYSTSLEFLMAPVDALVDRLQG